MQVRNRLWRAGKSKKSNCGDVRILNPDGSLNKVVPIRSAPVAKPKEDNADIVNERDNERYIEWRQTILKRDRKTCVLCGSKEWLQVHHIIRWVDDPQLRYDLQNGVTLCIPCHSKHHGPEMQPFPANITNKLMEHINTLYGDSETIRCADKSIPAH